MKPTNFDNLKTPKAGHQWVSRGKGWNNGSRPTTYAAFGFMDRWEYYTNNTPMGYHDCEYAELVPIYIRPTLEEQITLAKSMVGKKYTWKNKEFTAKSWHITNKASHTDHSGMVVEEVHQFGVCVYVLSVGNAQYAVLNEDLVEVIKPLYKEVTLNNTYNAKVYADKIEVGCQTFDINILEDLIKASKEISNQ